MFDRCSEHARKSLSIARQEALRWNHDYIGTEHLLLGVLAGGSGDVDAALRELKIDPSTLRAAVDAIVKPGANAVTYGQLPFTPRGKVVLEQALEEAQRFGHDFIAPGHLLLGLMREGERFGARVFGQRGIAAIVLEEHGVKLDRLREVLKPKLDSAPSSPTSASTRHSPTIEIVGRDGAVIATRRWFFLNSFSRGDLVRIGDSALRIVDVVHLFPADDGPPSLRLVTEPT
jgi:ATP-dependent Clp protease ATP-binding subunit ClpA